MDKQQTKRVQKYGSWGLLAALVALLAAMPMLAGGQEPEDIQASILSAQVEQRDITCSLVGGGTLTAGEGKDITIPASVKLTEYLVKNGDYVEAGAPIARVDRISVMAAIAQIQDTLEILSEQIRQVREETAPELVTARAEGIVKVLYAREGEPVEETMLRHGALAALSLDGLMAVKLEADTDLRAGETVTVTFSQGTEAVGTVESNLEGTLTVTLVDEGFAPGEAVTVAAADGAMIGSGTLFIHSQWNAVAYSGTVSEIRVREGQYVTADQTLLRLENTGRTAEYYELTARHREYEAWMLSLFQLYQSRTLCANTSGIVTGVEENGAYMLTAAEGWHLVLLANAPDGEDEAAYVNYVGQVAEVGIDGVILNMNPRPQTVEDYKDLSQVSLDPAYMTETVVYSGQVPIYELAEGEWIQTEPSSLAPGDILLFAGDETGSFVWIVRIAGEVQPPEETEPAEPEQPTEPTEPEQPTEPAEPEQPAEPENPGQAETAAPENPRGDRENTGPGASQQPQKEATLYSLETVAVASVIPQEELLLEITLDELDISKIYEGQEARVTIDALGGEAFDALVTGIGSSGVSDGGNSKFSVTLTLKRQGDMLPGMTASAVIPLETVTGCLAVPVAALTETDTGTFLYKSYEEKTGTLADPAAVRLGISDGEWVRILSGIGEGETFWYAYYEAPK